MASRRMVMVFILLCIGVMNMLAFSMAGRDEYGLDTKRPNQESADAFKVMIYERLNVERWRNDLDEFMYIRDDRAQDLAATVLSTGNRSLNPSLEPGVGENVAYYRVENQGLPVLVDRIVSDMVNEMGGGRKNLLDPRFRYVSVGVAYDDSAICVVVDFYGLSYVD